MTAARLSCALFGVLLAACETAKIVNAPSPPSPPGNIYAAHLRGETLRRVALLPVFCTEYPEQSLREIDATFQNELTKRALFEVVPVSRPEMESLFGERQFASTASLPANSLTQLRARHGVDGVFFTDLTHFSPYRPVSMGVRAKLVAASTGQIRWAFDNVFDSGNTAIAEAAKRYQVACSNQHQPLTNDGGSILLSPSRFAKFVANETYGTLRLQ
jgi:hypothetical protein